MKFPITKPRRILIVGDAGRGKTTFAHRLSFVLGISVYSTDDFFWKTKYTEKQDPHISLQSIKHIYEKDSWIVEGATSRLTEGGLERADVILCLEFGMIMTQWLNLMRRHIGRKEERFQDLILLLRHVFYKRYGVGYERGTQTVRELIHPYEAKTVTLHSFKEMDEYLQLFSR